MCIYIYVPTVSANFLHICLFYSSSAMHSKIFFVSFVHVDHIHVNSYSSCPLTILTVLFPFILGVDCGYRYHCHIKRVKPRKVARNEV